MISRLFGAVVFLLSPAFSQTFPLDSTAGITLRKVKAEPVTYKSRQALRVTEVASGVSQGVEDSLAILTKTAFGDGTIEIDLAGEPSPGASGQARGFLGIAFRVAENASKFECFYLRPTNGRADDQVRRNHSAQYMSFPEFPWFRFRKEAPEKYESYVDLVPGTWTKVKIVVRGDKARLFVHGAEQPALVVNDLKHGVSKGAVALWIGPGTVAHFANLKIAPTLD